MTDARRLFPFPDSGQAGPPAEFTADSARPIAAATLRSGTPVLLLSGYEQVKALLASDRFGRAAAAVHGMTARTAESLALNSADPPDHTRRRRCVTAAFTTRRAERDRGFIRRTATGLVAAIAHSEPPADLIRAYSLPLAAAVICRVMGVPAADFPRLTPLVDVMMSTSGHSAARIAGAHARMFAYFAGRYDRERDRRTAGPPRTGVLADLAAAERDGKVGRVEAIHIASGLLIAGYETMANQIAICVSLLLAERPRWDRLRADPGGLRPAIEEMLRWTSLLATGGAPHVALTDTAVGSAEIPAGQVVIPVFAAANRDPDAFEEPDRLRLDRRGAPHVAFGHGRHLCLGAPLARVELAESLGALLRGLPGLRLDGPAARLRWRSGTFIRGLCELPIRW
jgi:cytochrome P450 monooxygenase OleP